MDIIIKKTSCDFCFCDASLLASVIIFVLNFFLFQPFVGETGSGMRKNPIIISSQQGYVPCTKLLHSFGWLFYFQLTNSLGFVYNCDKQIVFVFVLIRTISSTIFFVRILSRLVSGIEFLKCAPQQISTKRVNRRSTDRYILYDLIIFSPRERGHICPPVLRICVWLNCYCWGNSSILEGRF